MWYSDVGHDYYLFWSYGGDSLSAKLAQGLLRSKFTRLVIRFELLRSLTEFTNWRTIRIECWVWSGPSTLFLLDLLAPQNTA